MTRQVFVRFISSAMHAHSGARIGVFQVLQDLRESGSLSAAEEALLNRTVRWFNVRLARPERFSRGPHANAISWFRASATQHIARMRELAGLLERHGVVVDIVRTERPGYVVYEDEFQVVAVPFRDTAGQ